MRQRLDQQICDQAVAMMLTLLTVIQKAEIVCITTLVLFVLYIMYSLNLFKRE